jgi:putative endonuclease
MGKALQALQGTLKRWFNSTRAIDNRTPKRAGGDAAEVLAVQLLERAGLVIIERNYNMRFGEVDVIACEPSSGAMVFVEVRLRSEGISSGKFGGALASISPVKQQRIRIASNHFLTRIKPTPPCRFDVVLVGGDNEIEWIKNAFE